MKNKIKRAKRVRAKLKAVNSLPRLSIARSSLNIWAQIIDDVKGVTIAAVSSKSLKEKGTKSEIAAKVGAEIAKQAQLKKVTSVVFDRGSFRFHGRVKALAEAARKGGLKF